MRYASGTTDQYLYFIATDATDLKTRETGLTTFTVYRSRNGAAAAAFTTPTINETDSVNCPGVYELLLDEDMTIDASNITEEMVLHITHAGMAPVDRTIEIFSTAAMGIIDYGTAQSATSTSLKLRAAFSTADDNIIGSSALINSSTLGQWQSRTAYDWGNTAKDIAVDAWSETPTGTISYFLFGTAPASSASPIPVRVTKWVNTDVPTPDAAGYPIVTLKAGTGAGELSIASGVVDANAVQISADATAADNAEAFFDGTGYAGTGNVIPTVTAVTTVNGLAANVITAAATAADFTTEIQTGLATAASLATTDGKVDTINTATAAILADTGTDGVVVAAASKTGYALSATGSAALTEAYAADGAAPTLNQMLYQIWSMLSEKAVASTTVTCKKLDGTTTAMTFTLDSATDPTSITRAT
jgi:hypothetical protein